MKIATTLLTVVLATIAVAVHMSICDAVPDGWLSRQASRAVRGLRNMPQRIRGNRHAGPEATDLPPVTPQLPEGQLGLPFAPCPGVDEQHAEMTVASVESTTEIIGLSRKKMLAITVKFKDNAQNGDKVFAEYAIYKKRSDAPEASARLVETGKNKHLRKMASKDLIYNFSYDKELERAGTQQPVTMQFDLPESGYVEPGKSYRLRIHATPGFQRTAFCIVTDMVLQERAG